MSERLDPSYPFGPSERRRVSDSSGQVWEIRQTSIMQAQVPSPIPGQPNRDVILCGVKAKRADGREIEFRMGAPLNTTSDTDLVLRLEESVELGSMRYLQLLRRGFQVVQVSPNDAARHVFGISLRDLEACILSPERTPAIIVVRLGTYLLQMQPEHAELAGMVHQHGSRLLQEEIDRETRGLSQADAKRAVEDLMARPRLRPIAPG